MGNPASLTVNLAAYRFVALDRLDERRETLQQRCLALGLKGTILLSAEGINLFVAGPPQAVETLLRYLREDPLLADLTARESLSRSSPFGRMRVRIKREIIPFGSAGFAPLRPTSARLSPPTLKYWLDAGRDVTLLDVRNDFEIDYGTFAKARCIGIASFREFAAAASVLPEELKQRPVVTFCTGGIRCEKAAPCLEQQGFAEVYLLEGGILKYFEQCGGAHFRGDCFVFDERIALDCRLQPVMEQRTSASLRKETPRR